MRLTFCSSDASAAVIAVFTWSVSLITRARSCPPRVRWKNPSESACRCSNRRTRRSRTTFSWMATLVSAATYASTFLSTSVPSSTSTTLRSAAWGAPAPSTGPTTAASSRSTAEPPDAGRASCPNSVRRKGMSSTNVTPSSTEATTVVTRLATNSGVYGRSSSSNRVLRPIQRAPPPPARPPPARPRGVSRATGRIISSGVTPPCRNDPR